MGMNRGIDIWIIWGCINNSGKIFFVAQKYVVNGYSEIDIELGHAMT